MCIRIAENPIHMEDIFTIAKKMLEHETTRSRVSSLQKPIGISRLLSAGHSNRRRNEHCGTAAPAISAIMSGIDTDEELDLDLHYV